MLGTARISRGSRRPEVAHFRGPSRAICCEFPLPALIEDRFALAAESTGVSGLAERYAAALFELADEQHALDAVAGDLRELRAMLHASSDLMRLVRSQVLARAEQGKAMAALAEDAKLSQLTAEIVAAQQRSKDQEGALG